MRNRRKVKTLVDGSIAEDQILADVRGLIKEINEAAGWPRESPYPDRPPLLLCYHTHRSDRSEPGFFDLVLMSRGLLLLVELKSEHGVLSQAQRWWRTCAQALETLTGGIVRYRLWTAEDLVTGAVTREITDLVTSASRRTR